MRRKEGARGNWLPGATGGEVGSASGCRETGRGLGQGHHDWQASWVTVARALPRVQNRICRCFTEASGPAGLSPFPLPYNGDNKSTHLVWVSVGPGVRGMMQGKPLVLRLLPAML